MHPMFSWIDYTIFVVMLILSAIIGIYYGFIKTQKTASDFLMGGKQISVWPMAMSIVSSQLSGLVIISLPADIYRYGITFWLTCPIMIFVSLGAYYIYLPVFYKLDVTSIYEYLNVRFNNRVRIFASVLFTIHMLLFLSIIIYVPAVALTKVTGVSVFVITPMVCGVCIFYTTLGGMKAMVKTDAIQFGIMMGTVTTVLVLGTWAAGGVGEVMKKAYDRGRLHIDFEFSFTKRDTFWAGTVGAFFMITHHFPCNQSYVQKCLSVPSFKSVKAVLILSTIGVVLVKSLCMYGGLVMFAKYSDCDPVERGIIKNHDQLFPMYVMEDFSYIPGFPGLILSGIFSAALSTLSAAMNCLSATIYQDFISPYVSKGTSQERISWYLKSLVVIIGIFAASSVVVVEKLGNLLQLAISFGAVTGGPLVGLFSVGMLVPMVHSTGALCGGIVSLVVMTWMIMTGLWYKARGIITYPILAVSTEGCNDTLNSYLNQTVTNPVAFSLNDSPLDFEEPFILYRISFYWFLLFGVTIVFVVSIAVSYFTTRDKPLNRDCISVLSHFLIKDDATKPPEYDSIEKSLKIVNNG